MKFKKAHFQEMRKGLPIIENAYKGAGSLGEKGLDLDISVRVYTLREGKIRR